MLLWATDIHLNFLRIANGPEVFGKILLDENPEADGIIITGDISTGTLFEEHLLGFARGFTKPVYFVLGNHDYYNSSFDEIDAKANKLSKKISHLHWLNKNWHLHNGIPIVGVDGWYDAYYGNAYTNNRLSDFFVIKDLVPGLGNRDLLIDIIRKRANQQANRLNILMNEACQVDSSVIVVGTHVAPYKEASWYNGKISEDDMLSWFSSASIGEVIDNYADECPEKKFIVLCGHCHSFGTYRRRNNIIVYTGYARYHHPSLAGILAFEWKKIWVYRTLRQKISSSYLESEE